MMKLIPFAVLTALALSAGAAGATERSVVLAVDNMTCASCPYIVRKTLEAVPGVAAVEVSFERKSARVTFDDADTDVEALVKATAANGYPSHEVKGPQG